MFQPSKVQDFFPSYDAAMPHCKDDLRSSSWKSYYIIVSQPPMATCGRSAVRSEVFQLQVGLQTHPMVHNIYA